MTNYPRFIFKSIPLGSINEQVDAVDIDNSKEQEKEQSSEESAIVNSEEQAILPKETVNVSHEELESIKNTAFTEGVESAKGEYEERLQLLTEQANFANLIEQKLTAISPQLNIDQEILSCLMDMVVILCKKLSLSIEPDFTSVISNALSDKILKLYSGGNISIFVHSNRYDLTKEFCISHDKLILPEKFSIFIDDNLEMNDCRIELENGCLNYDSSKLENEIFDILSKLKQVV